MKTNLLLLAAGAVAVLVVERVLAWIGEYREPWAPGDGFGCCGPDECCTAYHPPEFNDPPQLEIADRLPADEIDQLVAQWRKTLKLDGGEYGR